MIPAILMFYYSLIINGNRDPIVIKDYIAVESIAMGVNPQIMQGLAEKESKFNCNAVGDHGTSFGCFQIHNPESKKVRPLSKEEAKDVIKSTNWAIQTVKEDGDCHQWSTCHQVMDNLYKQMYN